jgi:phosphate transport system substrate-binding protein
MKPGRWLLPLLAASCFVLPSCSLPEGSVTIQGAGATFPAPLYKRWFLEYYHQHPETRVNYQAIGSGSGVRKFIEGLTAFAASDAGVSKGEAEEFQKAHGCEVQLIPMTAGSIVICYNLPGWKGELRLTRNAYLKIFLGEITTWNDPAIVASNSGANLPSLDITVVRRADDSGTTYAFTSHLEAVGKSLNKPWPSGKNKTWPFKEMIGGRGNPGVAAQVQQIPGAVGYLESGFAELAELPAAALENKTGKFVASTPSSSQAALATAKIPDDFRIAIPDPEGEDVYPIVTYTWLACYKDYAKFAKFGGDPKTGATLKRVIHYCLTDGQSLSAELGYIPLPKNVVDRVLEAVKGIKE